VPFLCSSWSEAFLSRDLTNFTDICFGLQIQNEIRDATKALQDVLAGEDVDAIKEKTNALSQATMKIGEALNKSGGDAGSSEQSSENTENKDNKQ
jgi:molecular chaperone DnaK